MVLILGCGFTGSRVRAKFHQEAIPVLALRRSEIDFTTPDATRRLAEIAPAGCLVLHSIPSLPDQADARLLEALEGKARRVVYLSTTAVYGATEWVDETTPPAPRTPRELARAATEQAVQSGSWDSLILRPAAIYGPGRGVHVAMAEGRYTLNGDGANYISRIHVDDLAALAHAALKSDLTGAYPVGDEHPCPAREIAEYCATQFQLPMPPSVSAEASPESRRGNRRVDGRAICHRLGIRLAYPSYREGLAR